MWGVVTPEEAKEKIEEQKQKVKGEPNNLEEQAISLVGRDIYENLIKGYTEKQWEEIVRNFQLLSLSDFLFGSLLITTTSMLFIRVLRLAVTQRWLKSKRSTISTIK